MRYNFFVTWSPKITWSKIMWLYGWKPLLVSHNSACLIAIDIVVVDIICYIVIILSGFWVLVTVDCGEKHNNKNYIINKFFLSNDSKQESMVKNLLFASIKSRKWKSSNYFQQKSKSISTFRWLTIFVISKAKLNRIFDIFRFQRVIERN